eukprot:373680-Rhodomonas_salina.2
MLRLVTWGILLLNGALGGYAPSAIRWHGKSAASLAVPHGNLKPLDQSRVGIPSERHSPFNCVGLKVPRGTRYFPPGDSDKNTIPR